jgi:dienelactone hydrolase
MIEIEGFSLESVDLLGETRAVYKLGSGRAVVVLSEIPGITPETIRFARRLADASFAVYVPQLFGEPMRPMSPGYAAQSVARVCIRREIHVLAANGSSPMIGWLRELAKRAHAECGGPGVGVVGMCITGNFGLAMMMDAPVTASVLSQPSLPVGPTAAQRAALHVSPEELVAVREKVAQGARVLGLRFTGDPLCPPARFERLRQELGSGFEGIEIPSEHANPRAPKPAHSVLTHHLIDAEGEPTRAALDRTLAFLRERLGA